MTMEMAFTTKPTYCPNVLSVQYFVKSLGIEPDRSQIREQITSSTKYPLVTVNDITTVLGNWNINCAAFKAKTEILPQLGSPFIAHYTKANDKYFVVVENVDSNYVDYYLPQQGHIKESFGDFLNNWTGIIVVANTEEVTTITLPKDLETIEADRYKNECVKIIPAFLSTDECQAIIDYTETQSLFQRSEVVEYATGKVNITDHRTSFSATLSAEELPMYSKIQDKVAELLQIPKSHIEALQCVRYCEGQEFKPHHDSGSELHRLHTLLIYLNDDFEGGQTYFPELFFAVNPKRGSALHFLNQDTEGNVIPYSFHAGLPIKNGIKYACNIWVKDRPIN